MSHWPVSLTEGGDVGEALVTCWVVVSIGRAGVRHRGPLLFFVTLLCRFLLSTAQFQLPAVYQQGLVGEWLLEGSKGGGEKMWDSCHSFFGSHGKKYGMPYFCLDVKLKFLCSWIKSQIGDSELNLKSCELNFFPTGNSAELIMKCLNPSHSKTTRAI